MKCRECGEINDKDSRFCSACGEPLVPANPLKKLLYKQNTIRPDMHDPNRAKAASPNEVFPGEYAPRGSADMPRRVEVRGEGAHVKKGPKQTGPTTNPAFESRVNMSRKISVRLSRRTTRMKWRRLSKL